MGIVISFLIGGTAALVAVLIGCRQSSRMRQFVAKWAGMGDAETSGSLFKDALEELKKDAPDLAKSVEQEPKSPVAEQPDEFKASVVRRVQEAPNEEAALEIVKRAGHVRDDDVARILWVLANWKPRRRDAGIDLTERDYEESLIRSLQRQGFSGEEIEQQRQISWSADEKHGGGSRSAVPDMIIRDKVLVELKGDLVASSDADRALGQMLRYLMAWKGSGPAILAICGYASPEMAFLVRSHIRLWRKELKLPVTVYFRRDDVPTDSKATFSET